MIKNESQFYFKSNLKKNNSMILKCRTSKSNNLSSRNPVFEIKNKVSSKFKLFKNLTIYKNHSKKTSNKNDEFPKNDINSNHERQNILSNSVNINPNFIRRLPSKNNRSKAFEPKTICINNNTNFINILNIYKSKIRRTNSIRQKLLFRQKDYIRMNQQNDSIFSSSFYSTNRKPCIKNIKKYFINADKSNKIDFEQDDLNTSLLKNRKNNFCFCSFNNDSHSQKKAKSTKRKKFAKNYKIIKILKKSNSFLFSDKDNNLGKEKKLHEVSNKNINNKNKHEYVEQNISTEEENIIDNNYYEYLKDNSSSSSNKDKCHEINLNKNKDKEKIVIKSLTSLKNKLNDSSAIFQYIKLFNQFKYPETTDKNNKKLSEFKMYSANKRKNLENINKDIAVKNVYLRKK